MQKFAGFSQQYEQDVERMRQLSERGDYDGPQPNTGIPLRYIVAEQENVKIRGSKPSISAIYDTLA